MAATRSSLLALVALAAVVAAAFLFGYVKGVPWAPRPGLAVLAPIDREQELARWQAAPELIKKNRYAPQAIRTSLSAEETNNNAARYVAFARARKAVLHGTADRPGTISYYRSLIGDREERIAALEYLRPQRMLSASSPPAFIRGSTDMDELARLKEAVLQYRVISELLSVGKDVRPPPTKKSVRDRVICFVDAAAIVYCALEDALVNRALAGYWKKGIWETLYFNEAHAYETLKRLDDIAKIHELDTTKNTFVACANGGWWAADTAGPQLGSPKGMTPKELPSIAEMQKLAAGCRSLSAAPGALHGDRGMGGRSQMATDTIKRIDENVSNCKEGPQGLVAAGDRPDRGGPWFSPLPGPLDILDAAMNTPHPGPDFKREAEAAETEKLRREAIQNDLAILHHRETAALLDKRADELEKEADEEADAEKEKKAAELRKQAEILRRDADCRATYGMSCAEYAARKKAAERDNPKPPDPSQPPGTQPPGSQLDGVNYSSCASRKADWEAFKAECERTGGWDRPGSECNEFIRRANGCVSTTVINPHPDGDRTCIRVTLSEAEQQKKSCELRQKFMSVAEPLEVSCRFLDRNQFETSWADPCNDPAATPTPDTTCPKPGQSSHFPGAPSGGKGDPVPPRPYGDLLTTKDGIVFDALRLEGLGFTVPNNVPGISMR